MNTWTADGFSAATLSVPAGALDVPPADAHVVDINLGAPARVLAWRDGQTHNGVHVPGDVDIIPAGIASHWEAEMETGSADVLLLRLAPDFLRGVAARCGLDPDRVELVNQFQTRDPQIEHIGLALKSDLETAGLGGPLYRESLATALAVRLLTGYNAFPLEPPPTPTGGLSPADLRRALDHIRDRLDANPTLAELAGIVYLSPSHFTRLFRRSTGLAPHQYVIARRVEEAERLLRRGGLTVGEVAARVGFASQSHLNRHFKRLCGVPPGACLPRNSANVQETGANVEAFPAPALP